MSANQIHTTGQGVLEKAYPLDASKIQAEIEACTPHARYILLPQTPVWRARVKSFHLEGAAAPWRFLSFSVDHAWIHSYSILCALNGCTGWVEMSTMAPRHLFWLWLFASEGKRGRKKKNNPRVALSFLALMPHLLEQPVKQTEVRQASKTSPPKEMACVDDRLRRLQKWKQGHL